MNESEIDKLILSGALEPAAIDNETGEMLYNFSDKVKTFMPDLYNEHLKTVNKEMMDLWESGYLSIDLFSDNPIVSLTSKSMSEEEVGKLNPEKRRSLNEIKRILLA